MSRPDWPSHVRDWPRFWAVYDAWRAHLARRASSPPKRDVRAQPRKRPTAAWERALRLAPPDGGEEEAVVVTPPQALLGDGDGGEEGSEGGDGEASPPPPPPQAPPVLTGKEWWSLAAATTDAAIARAVESVHRSLPTLLAAKVPVPETLDPLDPWKDSDDAIGLVEGFGGEETSGGFDLRWRESRDPSALPTYLGAGGAPGPRSPTGQQLAASSLTAKEAAEAAGGDGSSTASSSSTSGGGGGVVEHAWSSWGDVELRAWSEKRRAHERAEAAFARKQALVGKHKAFNVDETTDVRMRRKVAGLPHFQVSWTHEDIMRVITNGGENVHPDAASPALGVGDPGKKLDYWEEGVHAAPDIVDVIAAAGRLADADSLPDVVAAAAAAASGGGGGGGVAAAVAAAAATSKALGEAGGGGGDDAAASSGRGAAKATGRGASATTGAAARASSSSSRSPSSSSSSSSSSSVTLPPSSVAASATFSETFEGLDVNVDDDEMGDGGGGGIGGVPGLDVDPDDDV